MYYAIRQTNSTEWMRWCLSAAAQIDDWKGDENTIDAEANVQCLMLWCFYMERMNMYIYIYIFRAKEHNNARMYNNKRNTQRFSRWRLLYTTEWERNKHTTRLHSALQTNTMPKPLATAAKYQPLKHNTTQHLCMYLCWCICVYVCACIQAHLLHVHTST